MKARPTARSGKAATEVAVREGNAEYPVCLRDIVPLCSNLSVSTSFGPTVMAWIPGGATSGWHTQQFAELRGSDVGVGRLTPRRRAYVAGRPQPRTTTPSRRPRPSRGCWLISRSRQRPSNHYATSWTLPNAEHAAARENAAATPTLNNPWESRRESMTITTRMPYSAWFVSRLYFQSCRAFVSLIPLTERASP